MTTEFGDMSVDDYILGDDPIDELYLGTDLIFRRPIQYVFTSGAVSFGVVSSFTPVGFTYNGVEYTIDSLRLSSNFASSPTYIQIRTRDALTFPADVLNALSFDFERDGVMYELSLAHATREVRGDRIVRYNWDTINYPRSYRLSTGESLTFTLTELAHSDTSLPFVNTGTSRTMSFEWTHLGIPYTVGLVASSSSPTINITFTSNSVINTDAVFNDLEMDIVGDGTAARGTPGGTRRLYLKRVFFSHSEPVSGLGTKTITYTVTPDRVTSDGSILRSNFAVFVAVDNIETVTINHVPKEEIPIEPPAGAQAMYAGGRALYRVGHVTGRVLSQVGTASLFGANLSEVRDLAVIGNVMYLIDDSTNALYTVDVTTGVASRVGSATNFGVNETQPGGIAAIGNTLYMSGDLTRALFTLNTSTGVATRVGTANAFSAGLFSPAFLTSIGNTLYMIDNARLYSVHPVTGVATRVGSAIQFGASVRTASGLASIGNTLYLLGSAARLGLYTVDTSTGVATRVGTSDFVTDRFSDFGIDAIAAYPQITT